MPCVLIDHLSGERAGAVDRFDAEVITVGRSADCDLPFEEMGVSWAHAELRLRDGDYWIIDQGSTNGTYINDERAHNARLKDGDVIKFGKKGPVLRFRLEDVDKRSSGALPALAPESAGAAAAAAVPSPPPRPRPRRRLPSEPDHPVPILDARSDLPPAAPARRSPWGLAAVLVLGVASAAAITVAGLLFLQAGELERELEKTRGEAAAAREELREVEGQLDVRLDEARNEGKRLVESMAAAQVDRLERELERSRKHWEEKSSQQSERIQQLERTLSQARAQLTQQTSGAQPDPRDNDLWKRIERRLNSSVLFIATQLEGKTKSGQTVPLHSFGTGFFASSQGHIVTNKHVVEPWKFREMAERLAREGITIVEDSYQIHVWPGGSRFLRRAGGKVSFDIGHGYSTANQTLRLVRTADDQWHTLPLGGEGSRQLRVHVDAGNHDLALLRAHLRPGERVEPIPAGRSDDLEKLDEVLVLGFPAGPSILEAGIAETSPARGQVRKVEQTIFVTAAMMGGNSGGPLIDRRGRVVGISTRVVGGTETLGSCLKIEHALQLLRGGAW